jgi:hypothetical protein
MNSEFGKVLESRMKHYNSAAHTNSGLAVVQSKLDAVKGVMVS